MRYARYIILTGLLIFVTIPVVLTQNILENKIQISFETGTREQFIDTIKSQTQFRFLYTDLVSPEQQVTIGTGDYSIGELLDTLFFDKDLSYIVRNDLIILSPKGKEHELEQKVIIQGRVTARKEKSVPFATVYLLENSRGTITNAEGYFRLIIPESLSGDTLVISSMGFEEAKIAPEEYKNSDLTIRLKSSYIPIKDVIVRPNDPEKLVMQSFNARKNNYSKQKTLLKGFFRESSKQNDDYISLTEALIEINKSSYLSSADDLVRLVKGRNGTNINQSELVNLVVEGGLYNGLRLDIAKYGSYFYAEDALDECNFRMLKNTMYNGRQTYIVWFDMKENPDYSGYTGRLYIDAESLALVRAEFELSPAGIRYARSVLIKKTPKGFKAKPLYAKYEVEYRFYNDIWNLHYARNELKIKVRKTRGKKNKGYSSDFISKSEFVITDQIINPDKNIRYREASRSNDILVRQVENTGSTFWLDDNVIVPEEPLLSTIEKLQNEGILPKEDSVITKENDQ